MSAGKQVALKIHRRRYPRAATWEIYVHSLLNGAVEEPAFVKRLAERPGGEINRGIDAAGDGAGRGAPGRARPGR